jgi:hypothetical protein
MRFEHYKDHPIESFDRREYPQAVTPYGKPKGVWVSAAGEDDWPSWCRSERFGVDRLEYRHLIELDTRRMKIIESVAELDRFDALWGVAYSLGDMPFHCINWPEVAKEFTGIVIAPYRWERRMDTRVSKWYYGWDCASGCVWDVTAIKSVQVTKGENHVRSETG